MCMKSTAAQLITGARLHAWLSQGDRRPDDLSKCMQIKHNLKLLYVICHQIWDVTLTLILQYSLLWIVYPIAVNVFPNGSRDNNLYLHVITCGSLKVFHENILRTISSGDVTHDLFLYFSGFDLKLKSNDEHWLLISAAGEYPTINTFRVVFAVRLRWFYAQCCPSSLVGAGFCSFPMRRRRPLLQPLNVAPVCSLGASFMGGAARLPHFCPRYALLHPCLRFWMA